MAHPHIYQPTKKIKNMNKELLFQLYSIHSPSGREKKMRRFIKKYIARNCGACNVVQDAIGNLLITKGESDTYPCLAAHMDQVQDAHSKDFSVIEIGGDVLGWSPKSHAQQGLGADDKNGVFICLELLRQFDVMKVAFFVGEEVGCKGSSAVDLEFFKDCRFIVEPDRRGGHDLITSMFCGDVCSEDFIKAIGYEKFGYKFDEGSITDVGELVERGVGISCLNLSCGYYHAHSDNEITILSELENCLHFVAHIVNTCTDVYPFELDYGSYHGLYGGYRSFGRCLSPRQHKKSEDDYIYYVDGGYYDEDYTLMDNYLTEFPDLSFEQLSDSLDFHAHWFFSRDEATDCLRDIYYDVANSIKNEPFSDEKP